MIAATQKNLRKWPRRKARTSARVECRKGSLGLGPNYASEFLDISEAGMRLIVTASFNPRDEVEITIRDYGQRNAVKRVSSICWCVALQDGRFCIGLSFEKWISYAEIQQVSKP